MGNRGKCAGGGGKRGVEPVRAKLQTLTRLRQEAVKQVPASNFKLDEESMFLDTFIWWVCVSAGSKQMFHSHMHTHTCLVL